MSRLKPMDLAFFALENPHRPMHMAAFELFELPQRHSKDFVADIVAEFRCGAVAAPFNQKLRWLRDGVAAWEAVDVDLDYHVRHIAVPQPGNMQQLYEMLSFLNASLLDRAYPLWETWVIEGIEGNRFAIFIKVHHACIDGGAGMRLFQQSLSTSARDKTLKAFWTPFKRSRETKPTTRKESNELKNMLTRLEKLPESVRNWSTGFASFGAKAVGLKPKSIAMPLSAKKTLFNITATSSARRYANCELSLPLIKSIASATGCTVNDVVMTAIDNAMQRYLVEEGEDFHDRLVAFMAMSLRDETDQTAKGNQVSAILVPMGSAGSAVRQRLDEVHAATQRVKEDSRNLPSSVLQAYTLVIAGGSAIAEIHPALNQLPNANVLISNMVGPKDQLYLRGARLLGFHGLPIVAPGLGVNVTFLSVADTICLGVAAVPEAIPQPLRLTALIEGSLQELAQLAAKPRQRITPAKKKLTTKKKQTAKKKQPVKKKTKR